MNILERLIDKYFCIKTIIALLKEDFYGFDISQFNKVNCFAFLGGDFKLLKIAQNYDKNWKDCQELINDIIITENYKENEQFDLSLIKSILCSKSNNEGKYFYHINIKNTCIKPKDILYLFGFNNYQTSKKNQNGSCKHV